MKDFMAVNYEGRGHGRPTLAPGPWPLAPNPWSLAPNPWSLALNPWSLALNPSSLIPEMAHDNH